jgi:hypothetical protein
MKVCKLTIMREKLNKYMKQDKEKEKDRDKVGVWGSRDKILRKRNKRIINNYYSKKTQLIIRRR